MKNHIVQRTIITSELVWRVHFILVQWCSRAVHISIYPPIDRGDKPRIRVAVLLFCPEKFLDPTIDRLSKRLTALWWRAPLQ